VSFFRLPKTTLPSGLILLLIAIQPRPATAALQRLGQQVLPTFEAIRLVVDSRQPAYNGAVHIELAVKEEIDTFRFHSKGLEIKKLSLLGPSGDIPVTYLDEGGIVRVDAGRRLPIGEYKLEVDFANRFDTKGSGLYKLEESGTSYIASQFQPDDARRAFPCWDEPGFKIPYQITLVVPAEHLAFSNTPIEDEKVADASKTIRFARTRPLPSYLLAVATGPFETVPILDLGVPANLVTLKGKSKLTGEALRSIPPILKAVERYFGGRYPYEKLDFIALPGFWMEAMENPGAVMFDESHLLLDPAAVSLDQRRVMAVLVAHELAHMWFGNLVTMKWWDDLWLNESFASWMGYKIAREVFPTLRTDLTEVTNSQSAMEQDARPSVRAIRQPVQVTDNLNQYVDALTYKKGRVVLAMFEEWLGPEVFREGVLRYLHAHEWGNTTAADLFRALSQVSGKDVGVSMSTFLDQGGIPLVEVKLVEAGKVELSQKRFLNFGTQAQSALWQVPVTLKVSDGKRTESTILLLSRPTQAAPLPLRGEPVWVLPNAGQNGYYRWLLPSRSLLALATNASQLAPRDRVGLIGNLSALADAGLIGGGDELRVLHQLANDPEPQVIMALLRNLGEIWFTFRSPELEEPFAAYVRATLGPALKRFGLSRAPGEDESTTALRPVLLKWLAEEGKDEEMLRHAQSLAHTYLENPSKVDPELVEPALSAAALRGDRVLFEEFKKRFEIATVPAERRKYLVVLASFTAPELVDQALRYVLEGPLRPQELLVIPRQMGNSMRLMQWITTNYEKLTSRIPAQQAVYLPYYALGCSLELLEATRSFFTSATPPKVPGTDVQLAKVTEQVKECHRLREHGGESVASYLRSLASQP